MRRNEVSRVENSKKTGEPENTELVRTLVENMPADIIKQTTLLRKKVPFKEEIEDLGLDQASEEWLPQEKDGAEEIFSGKSEDWNEGSVESDARQILHYIN